MGGGVGPGKEPEVTLGLNGVGAGTYFGRGGKAGAGIRRLDQGKGMGMVVEGWESWDVGCGGC